MDTLPIISLEKLKDHGISPELVQKTIDASRNFFQLPEETKKAYSQEKQTVEPKTCRGYSPMYGKILHYRAQSAV